MLRRNKKDLAAIDSRDSRQLALRAAAGRVIFELLESRRLFSAVPDFTIATGSPSSDSGRGVTMDGGRKWGRAASGFFVCGRVRPAGPYARRFPMAKDKPATLERHTDALRSQGS